MPPSEARAVLVEAYDADARQEALLRAFLAELDRDHAAARFWVAVYDLIVIASEPEADHPGEPGGGAKLTLGPWSGSSVTTRRADR